VLGVRALAFVDLRLPRAGTARRVGEAQAVDKWQHRRHA